MRDIITVVQFYNPTSLQAVDWFQILMKATSHVMPVQRDPRPFLF